MQVERMPGLRRALDSDHAAGWALIAPAVILVIVFGLLPIGWSFLLSFQRSNLIAPPRWTGLDNYRFLIKDPTFRESVRHTLAYTALFVPISVIGALFVAVA